MNNEAYSHNMLDNVIKDFHSIAPKDHDWIDLADVAAYQKNGNTAQKQVGQFLIDNYFNLTTFDDSQDGHTEITLDNLKTADLYTNSDKAALKKTQDQILMHDEITDTAIAAAVITPLAVAGAWAIPPFAPITLASGAVWVTAGAGLDFLYKKADEQKYADNAQKLHP